MHPDTPCKNCGSPLGLHRTSDEACPVPGTFINGDERRWRLDCRFTPKEESLPAGSDMGPAKTCVFCGCEFDRHDANGKCLFVKGRSFEGFGSNFREPNAASRTNLRKIVFSRWASLEERLAEQLKTDPTKPPSNFKIAGIQGFFHCFGFAYEEFDSTPANYSTAIVEDMAGQVFEIVPSDMKFVS